MTRYTALADAMKILAKARLECMKAYGMSLNPAGNMLFNAEHYLAKQAAALLHESA